MHELVARQTDRHAKVMQDRAEASRDSDQPDPNAPVGDGVVTLVGLFFIVVAAFVSGVVAGILTRDVLVFLWAAGMGLAFGVLWLFGIAALPLPRALQETSYSAAIVGGPVVAVVVALIVGAGYGWAVAVALVPSVLLVAAIWLVDLLLDRRTAGTPKPISGEGEPLSRDHRLAKLAARRDAGYLTPDEYEAIAADIQART